MFQVTEAQREKMKAVIGFIGCSGSGKTAGALLTAYGMMREAYSISSFCTGFVPTFRGAIFPFASDS
ncbi:hypothetical protein ACUODJ_41200, partial [Escherichia sp. HC-CC]